MYFALCDRLWRKNHIAAIISQDSLYTKFEDFVFGTIRFELCCGQRDTHGRNLLGYEGYRYPHFLDWGVLYPHLSWMKRWICRHRGDLRRLNYNKTVFGLGSALDLAGRARDTLPDLRVGWRWGGGYFYSPPHLSRYPRAPSPSTWYPHFLDQSYAPSGTQAHIRRWTPYSRRVSNYNSYTRVWP